MKQNDGTGEQPETQTTFRPYRSPESPASASASGGVSRKDIFLMSFLGFIVGGILLAGILFFAGAITGNVVVDLPGDEEVVTEETAASVIDTPAENVTTETPVEEVAENVTEVVEEPVVEEEPEPSDPCDTDIVLTLDEDADYNGKTLALKLAGDFASQISVGGQVALLSVGETKTINTLDIYLADGSEADGTATIQVVC